MNMAESFRPQHKQKRQEQEHGTQLQVTESSTAQRHISLSIKIHTNIIKEEGFQGMSFQLREVRTVEAPISFVPSQERSSII